MDSLGPEPAEKEVGEAEAGQRLDQFLVAHYPLHSRAHLRRVIVAGGVQVDGRTAKPAYRLLNGQRVTIRLPDLPRDLPEPENIPLSILYEDEHLLAVNKPPRMVVHPSKGHWSGTLTAALSHHFQTLSSVGGATRPGIVHRLDRDTSGVLVVAKTDTAHLGLAKQFEQRTTRKEYWALVVGTPELDQDRIEQPIGIHPYHREKMAIRAEHESSRAASTQYRVVERFRGFACLSLLPKTGRTHQLRVHLKHIGCPVLCDRLYGGRASLTVSELAGNDDLTEVLSRQALHAASLELLHPIDNSRLEFTAPLPADLQATRELLRTHRGRSEG